MRDRTAATEHRTAMTARSLTRRLLAAGIAMASAAAMMLAAAATAQARQASPAPRPAVRTSTATTLASVHRGEVRRSCAAIPAKGHASCLAMYLTDVTPHHGIFHAETAPDGYSPADLRAAYDLPSATRGSRQTVALIEAGDDPNAEADLGVYRAQFGLPTCTTASGCFRKVNQAGGTTYPVPDASWAEETSLDLDMVSAACPRCRILLVEANSATFADLGAAVDEAVALGAKFISNSYGGPETAGLGEAYNSYYNHPGVAVVASSGDAGYGAQYPAASSYVTSVGGTSLTRTDATSRGWAETVWNNTYGAPGSGCSIDEAKPSWQHDTGCPNRTVTDVSADADPATGVAAYDSYRFQGWDQFGGTSVAAPLITAAYALAGTPLPGTNPASYPYARRSALNDVTSGADGACTPGYLCTARRGYDGPTGLGTPHGVAAFTLSHGTITGTVTNASTRVPVDGAQIAVGGVTATTNTRGVYTLAAPAGSYNVTASDYTYNSATSDGVTITNGATTKLDFTLTPQPTVTISGQVTDGSGHGWPLYATVTASGVPGQVHTNPYTGHYSITVLPSASYTLTATPVTSGYQAASQQATVTTTNTTQNITVPVNLAGTACTTPGYTSKYATTYNQTFDGTSAPTGWTVQDVTGNWRAWVFDDPGQRGNLTGGSGGFAVADPAGEGGQVFSDLISPLLDLSNDPNPVLRFDTDDTNAMYSSVLVSTDGGNTWTSLTQDRGSRPVGGSDPTSLSGPGMVSFSLPQAANSSDVKIDFGDLNYSSGFWEIDNFWVGNLSCVPTPGGLLAGVVRDANTGAGIVGATVASTADPQESAVTMATPGDPGLPDGFYELFASGQGKQAFTISGPGNYHSQAETIRVVKDGVTRATGSLPAGDLHIAPARRSETVVSGKTVTEPVTISNSGAVTASFTLAAQEPDGSDAPWLSAAPAAGQIPAGGRMTVNVTLTSDNADATSQPGAYSASIVAGTNTPYTLSLPVTMTVTPLKTWGKITGTVTGATCDGGSTPLQNATVEITSRSSDYSLLTGEQGGYRWWLDQRNSPVTVIASLNGWQPQTRAAKIKAGRTTTADFTLQPSSSCSSARRK